MWLDLPKEIRALIVSRLDVTSLLAFRRVSSDGKHIVDLQTLDQKKALIILDPKVSKLRCVLINKKLIMKFVDYSNNKIF